jgi:hypothetical protein
VWAYLGLVALVNCWREWLREGPEGERKVDERVLELLQLLVALHQLVELQAHKTFGWVARGTESVATRAARMTRTRLETYQ